jgi:Calcineurin-like phosphoesterase
VSLKDKLRSRSAADLQAERDLLGFVRQPEVRWLDPALLVRAGVEVLVSTTFGKFADKREIQRESQDGLDYSSASELWFDFLSDTGDGWEATYTMAWLAAQPALEVGGESLPRGSILLLGGDEVYPLADPEAYGDRFIGPFGSALPRSEPGKEPHLYALPGNHDWYDGLVSFLRVFCARGWIGGWQTRQRRSYFGLKLPHDWWVLAIDIQLDTYLDDVQLDYFRALNIAAGDKVILVTSVPSWTHAYDGRDEPATWRYLSFFEERMIRDRGARLVATLSGDTHHYARYEPTGSAAGAPTRITAGGGGAYLSGTHTLPQTLKLKSLGRATDSGVPEDVPPVTYARDQIYPRANVSEKLGNGIVGLARTNPGFGRLLGVVYALVAIAMLGSVNNGAGRLVDDATSGGFGAFLGNSAGTLPIVLAIVLFVGFYGGTEIKLAPLEQRGKLVIDLARLVVGALQTLLHLFAIALAVWVALKIGSEIWDATTFLWFVCLAAAFGAGLIIGPTVFGAFLLLVHKTRGGKARGNANQVFSAQSIPDYKNFLRIHLAADGALTIYPLGVERVGREWDHVDSDGSTPRFAPRHGAPAVALIDELLQFDRAGNRSR